MDYKELEKEAKLWGYTDFNELKKLEPEKAKQLEREIKYNTEPGLW
ncbi:hypothetical protein G7084_00210 [Weissella coleopterorum]|uniref:Uncharacterized protein n=1 Tax=Weissella coleopterorum TaxID=2714949 RepID=A0A6G8AY49_9LACO|nr:hypothetical protein [Weissella coleopterorum]QIL49882.1 hypothetical protein G7084_00210 [Weissella coleopterorum]